MVSSLAARANSLPLPEEVANVLRLRHTKPAFYMLCGYLLAQAFQIPLVAIGPSWALWPTMSDLLAGALIFLFATDRRSFRIVSRANSSILRRLSLICCATFAMLLAAYGSDLLKSGGSDTRAGNFGVFQLYRLVQFTLIFRIAAGIPITSRRLSMLSFSVGTALLVVIAGLAGTYSSLLQTRRLVSHLPSDFSAAGPWAYLANTHLPDVGAIGYNHAYTALQIIMLAALYLALQTRQSRALVVICLLISLGGVFLTGSRAGMAAMIFLLAAYFIRRPSTLAVAGGLSVLLLLGSGVIVSRLGIDVSHTLARQLTLSEPLDPGNLSGRQDIWKECLKLLEEDPVRWVIGSGPGSATELGSNAHMLFLHILLEGGLVGLLIFGLAAYTVIGHLHQEKSRAGPLLWATTALLISSLTQETFYPVPAFGHFLGLYLCSIAIILNPIQRATVRGRQPNAGDNRSSVLQLGADAGGRDKIGVRPNL